MAEHGTRTMYVHYGCRCEACCKAEHAQYLKRTEAQERKRTNSKWSESVFACDSSQKRRETQKRHNRNRYIEYTHTTKYRNRIRWQDLVQIFGTKCAICGGETNSNDKWIGANGRFCYGRTYPTVDHIVSLKYGGTDTLDNVQLLCKRCNSVKGAKNAVAL